MSKLPIIKIQSPPPVQPAKTVEKEPQKLPSVFEKSAAIVKELESYGLTKDQSMSVTGALLNSSVFDAFINGTYKTNIHPNLKPSSEITYSSIKDWFKKNFSECLPDTASQVYLIHRYYVTSAAREDPALISDLERAYDPNFFQSVQAIRTELGKEFIEAAGATELFDMTIGHEDYNKSRPLASARMSQVHLFASVVNHLVEAIQQNPEVLHKLPPAIMAEVSKMIGSGNSLAPQALRLYRPADVKKFEYLNAATKVRTVPFRTGTLHLASDKASVPSKNVLTGIEMFGATDDVATIIDKDLPTGYTKVAQIATVDSEQNGVMINFYCQTDSTNPIRSNPFILGAFAAYLHYSASVPICKTSFSLRRGNVSKGTVARHIVGMGILPEVQTPDKPTRQKKVATTEDQAKTKSEKNASQPDDDETIDFLIDEPSPTDPKETLTERMYKAGTIPKAKSIKAGWDSPKCKQFLEHAVPDFIDYTMADKKSLSQKEMKERVHMIAKIAREISTEYPTLYDSLMNVNLNRNDSLHTVIEKSYDEAKSEFTKEALEETCRRVYKKLKIPYEKKNFVCYMIRLSVCCVIDVIADDAHKVSFHGFAGAKPEVKVSPPQKQQRKPNNNRNNSNNNERKGRQERDRGQNQRRRQSSNRQQRNDRGQWLTTRKAI